MYSKKLSEERSCDSYCCIFFPMDCNESYNVTLLTAVNILFAAWSAVKKKIINYFHHARFIYEQDADHAENYDNSLMDEIYYFKEKFVQNENK